METNFPPLPALFGISLSGSRDELSRRPLCRAIFCAADFRHLRLLDCGMKLADPVMRPQAFFGEFLGRKNDLGQFGRTGGLLA
jgi:hypothetical protein